MRIYLAGPYRNRDIVAQEANIRRGRQAAARLIAAGHDVECPWLDRELLQVDEEGVLSVDDLQRNSLSKLEHWAEAICLLEGWEDSVGTHAELCAAARLGLSVMWFLYDALPEPTDFCSVIEEYDAAGEFERSCVLDAALAERRARLEVDAREADATGERTLGERLAEVEARLDVVSGETAEQRFLAAMPDEVIENELFDIIEELPMHGADVKGPTP